MDPGEKRGGGREVGRKGTAGRRQKQDASSERLSSTERKDEAD